MSLARHLEVADLFATELERFLTTLLPGTTASRTYTPFATEAAFDAALAAAKAMLVFIVPLRKATGIRTRDQDQDDFSFRIVFAEKCRDRGLPSIAWMDRRVTLVAAAEEQFGDLRQAFDTQNGKLWAQESEVALVFDPEAHAENGTFWSVWHLTLREIA